MKAQLFQLGFLVVALGFVGDATPFPFPITATANGAPDNGPIIAELDEYVAKSQPLAARAGRNLLRSASSHPSR